MKVLCIDIENEARNVIYGNVHYYGSMGDVQLSNVHALQVPLIVFVTCPANGIYSLKQNN